MDAKGHEIVHLIVGLGHAGEDASDAALLFRLVDGFKSKMRLAVLLRGRSGAGIVASGDGGG